MTRTLHTLHSCRGGVCVLLVLKCRDAGMRPRRLPKMLRSLGADSKPAAQQAEKMRKTESQRMQRLKRFNAVIFRRGFWSSPKLCGGDRDSTHWLSVVLPIILEPITCRTDHWHLRLTLSWGFFDSYLKKHPSLEDSTQWTRLVADPAVESHGICMHLHAFAQINLNHPTLVISLSLCRAKLITAYHCSSDQSSTVGVQCLLPSSSMWALALRARPVSKPHDLTRAAA